MMHHRIISRYTKASRVPRLGWLCGENIQLASRAPKNALVDLQSMLVL